MATKARKSATAAKKVAVAKFADPIDPEKAAALAKQSLRPSINAAAVVHEYAKPFGEQDVGALSDSLVESIKDMNSGDMTKAEAMLYGQAYALQAIFMNLARRAAAQDQLKQWEGVLRMSLKAQNQCRMTLETLATIKNPPVVFARQANINNGGQQQVNNGTGATASRTPENQSVPNEQSGECHELLTDARASQATGGAHPSVEAVGAVNGAAQP